MRYGYFDNDQREYVVERPDTPWPWINFLGDGQYGAIISNNAGGYSFCRSSGHNRILRYRFNAVPCDRPGRYIYLRDAGDGDFWSNSWSPTQKPLDQHHTRCRHGQGYTRIESSYRGIDSAALYFVPLDDELEIWSFEVANHSDHQRVLDIFSYAEFGFPVFASESVLQAILYVASTSVHDNIIGYRTPVPGWRTAHRFFACSGDVLDYDTQRESFIGPWRGEDKPLAVERGQCFNSTGNGGNAVGCVRLRFELAPGEKRTVAFFLGEGKADERGVAVRARYTAEKIAASFAALQAHWDKRLSLQQVCTPDPAFDPMVNVWNPYQAHVTYHWSRAATLIEAGGRDGLGYRDTAQDIMSVLYSLGVSARGKITDLLKGQESRGCALHKVQPLTLEVGQGAQVPESELYSDDHLWLPLTLGAYVRETGDAAFLDERVPYLDRGEGTVFEHAWKSLEFTRGNLGPHGLALCLAAEWNDALQLGREGQSVWTSMQFCRACAEMVDLASLLGKTSHAAQAQAWKEEMARNINAHAWDGGWYLQALMNDGRTIGSQCDAVAQIWLNPQTWSVIAGVADGDRARRAMDAVHEHLASDYGLHLFSTPHTGYEVDVPGRVCYPPGLKENAGIFCHPNPWAVIAGTMLGDGDRAFAYYKALLPSARNDEADRRRVEPYVFCQFVTGKFDAGFGQAHNPWLTGTASWSLIAATQYILGIRPAFAGLVIDPCIPSVWDGFSVKRVFRGATYEITVRNPDHCCKGVASLVANGERLGGNLIPAAPAGATVKVEVVLGQRARAPAAYRSEGDVS